MNRQIKRWDVNIQPTLSKSGKVKEREYFVKIFISFFAFTGLGLLAISVWSGDTAVRSSAMDFFKLWFGALISIVSVMCTYYFKDD